jgi:TolB-like protein/tetratricopeptide (TPR) repeat protein
MLIHSNAARLNAHPCLRTCISMPEDQNRLLRFWKELKRRNVIRVITVYAATAFAVLELVDILAPSLGLPAWTLNFVLILLITGLVIAVSVSWIYDFHPLGGIVKTEPAEKRTKEDVPRFSNSWKIASYISFAVIAGLIVLNVLPRKGKNVILDKSIAVLPFRNESTDEQNSYFINGTMESILDNLCKIKDLRVTSRTSVEQYRTEARSVPDIAQALHVSYVLEGSGQKIGNRILLTVQLIQGESDQHIWSEQYDKRISEMEDLIDLQSDIARSVAAELQAIITPEEQKRMDQIPTTSTTAFDLYQKAGEVGEDEAVELLHYALEYDSTFALPYISLGWIYLNRYNFNHDLYKDYLDSSNRMIEKALHFDPQSAEAHSLKGYQLRQEGKIEEALLSFDRALQLNPNLANAYNGKGWIYFDEMDIVQALENFYQNIIRDRRPGHLGDFYQYTGFFLTNLEMRETAIQCYEKSLQYTGDSIWIQFRRAQLEFYSRNYQAAIDIALPVYEKITAKVLEENLGYASIFTVLGESNMLLGRYDESYKYYKRFVEIADSVNWPIPYQKMNIAFIFDENGQTDRALELIGQQIDLSEQSISENQGNKDDHYRHLAEAYMLKQDTAKALYYLKLLSQEDKMNVVADMTCDYPVFSGLKNDPEFIRISDQIHAKYLEEQERGREWLAENDILQ